MKGGRAEMLPLGADKALVNQHKYDREIAVICMWLVASCATNSLFEMHFASGVGKCAGPCVHDVSALGFSMEC
jgi:hypothetical protein